MLVDSHCHLDFPDFEDELEAIVKRATEQDVRLMVTICTRVRQFQKVLAVAERFLEVYCSVGTHPNNADEEMNLSHSDIKKFLDHEKVVAIGEAGLDYHYAKSSPANQKKSLLMHIEVARETQLPLVIHARDADRDMIDILETQASIGAFPGILHCFSSGAALARAGVDIGLHVSFSGILTFKNAQAIRDVAAEVPQDRLLVETDAPYLAPTPYRGKRNEPSYTAKTAEVLANIRGVSFAEIATLTTDNFFNLFNKIDRSLHVKDTVTA